MKHNSFLIAFATDLFLAVVPCAPNAQVLNEDYDFVPDEVIVQFRTTASAAQLADALQRGALSVKKHLPAVGKRREDSGLVLLKTKLPAPQALAALRNHPAIQYAEYNTIKRHQATNGIDDDGNGYVDDVYGYDFVNNDNTVDDGGKDKDDHGTHVAGTVDALGGNGLGTPIQPRSHGR